MGPVRSRLVTLWLLCLALSSTLAVLQPPLQLAWQLDCPQGFYSPPTVVGDTAYVPDVSGELRAVSLADGQLKWSFKAQDSLYGGVAVANGIGYVGSVDKHLYAIDLATGQPKWSKELDGVVYATPAVAGGKVVVGTGDTGTVYALDTATGAESWVFRLGARMGSGLTVADGVAFIGSYDHHLYALDLATMQPKWEFVAETVIDSRPLVADHTVYLKLTNDSVVALDQRTGQVQWRSTPLPGTVTDEPTTWSPLTKIGDLVLTALGDGRLLALRAAGGEPVWTTALGRFWSSPPAVDGTFGYLGSKDSGLCAIDLKSTAEVWDWQPAKLMEPAQLSGVMWPPVVAGDVLLAASMDGHLYAFRHTAGSLTAGAPLGSPVAGPGRIAMGGLFPVGYAGCLARHGLPHDLLYRSQLADLATLQRYDLVILTGSLEDPAASAGIQKYVQQGGTAIIDYSATVINLPKLPNGKDILGWTNLKSAAPGGFGAKGASLAPQPVVATSGPLADIPLPEGLVNEKALGYVPDPAQLTAVRVLAQYPSTVTAEGSPTGGPARPSILMGRLGRGRVVLCGYQLGLKSQYAGLDLEAIILALVKLASAGRATPQLIPDTPHVGYNATVSSASNGTPPAPVPMPVVVAEPTAGPGARTNLPQGFSVLEADPADEYEVFATVPQRSAEFLLHYWNAGNFVRLKLSLSSIEVERCDHGRLRNLASAKVKLTPGQPLLLKDSSDTLLVRSGEAYVTADLTGVHPGMLGQRGLSGEVEYQQTESVYFTDDFMRTDEQAGPWTTTGGEWSTTPEQNVDMGANPFSYKCRAPDGPATALSGYGYWDEYQATVAVHPTSGADGGSVALGWYAQDPNNLYLFRAAIRNGLDARPHGLQLVKLVKGQPTVLAQRDGGVSLGQWYQLHVRATGSKLTASLDGVEVLAATDATFQSGQVALRVDRGAARFDDVLAAASVLPATQGATIEGLTPNRAGLIDVDSWASPAMGWEPQPDANGVFWRREQLYGDADLTFAWPNLPDGAAVELTVDSDGRELDHGTVLELQRRGPVGQLSLRRDGRVLKAAEAPLAPAVDLKLRRRGELVEALLDGRSVLTGTAAPAGRVARVGFRAVGFLPKVSALTVWARNLRDYTFDTAPSDWWIGSGTWDLTNRWSCVPEWSWFGGFSEQLAAIWAKREFVDDLVLDAYVGCKMLDSKTPGYRGPSQERNGDFNVTLCGDGRDPLSGYSFVLGPKGAKGEVNLKGRVGGATAVLRRNGQVVARNDAFAFFAEVHNRWVCLRAEKHGATVSVSVDGQVVLQYTDPQPLERGYAGLWTHNNGMLIPRITIAYQKLGEGLLSLR